MDKTTHTVTLADGTSISGLTINLGSNTFHSPSKITAEMFDGNLSVVHISASDGDMSQCAYPDTLHNAELVQIMQPEDTPDGTWQFILRELSDSELRDRDTDTMLVDQEYRLTLLELGVDDAE